MFKLFFIVFLIPHALGDFYWQSDKLAQKKAKSYRYVMLHSLLYFLVFIICMLPFWSMPLIATALILATSHLLVDSIKFMYAIKWKENQVTYSIDQLIHILCIAAASGYLVIVGYELSMLPTIKNALATVVTDFEALLMWTGFVLLLLKPANITIRQITEKYRPGYDNSENSGNAGALIGSLERLIIALLLSIGQYAAIGLVLTAKSVARYNKISEDKQFAEYYLLGTLTSTLYAVIAFFVILR